MKKRLSSGFKKIFVNKKLPLRQTHPASMTDDANIYYALAKIYKHQSVNHKLGEYVRDNVHTNTIENFWSLFKRGIIGIYHQVSPKHLNKYLDEFEFRYNSKKENDESRIGMMLGKSEGYLSYKDLIINK